MWIVFKTIIETFISKYIFGHKYEKKRESAKRENGKIKKLYLHKNGM